MTEEQREIIQQALNLLGRFEYSSGDGWVKRAPEENEVRAVEKELKALLGGELRTVKELVQEIDIAKGQHAALLQEEAMTTDKARYAKLSGRDGLVNQAMYLYSEAKSDLRRRLEALSGVPFSHLDSKLR